MSDHENLIKRKVALARCENELARKVMQNELQRALRTGKNSLRKRKHPVSVSGVAGKTLERISG